MARLFDVFAHRWAVMGLWFVASVFGIMMAIAVGILLPAISSELDLTPGNRGSSVHLPLLAIFFWRFH